MPIVDSNKTSVNKKSTLNSNFYCQNYPRSNGLNQHVKTNKDLASKLSQPFYVFEELDQHRTFPFLNEPVSCILAIFWETNSSEFANCNKLNGLKLLSINNIWQVESNFEFLKMSSNSNKEEIPQILSFWWSSSDTRKVMY